MAERRTVERRIEMLRPEAYNTCLAWKNRVMVDGIDARITETLRSILRQASLTAAGLSSSGNLGWHNVGLAWDFLVFDGGTFNPATNLWTGGKPVMSGDDPRYAHCGAIAVELGCKYPIHLANGIVDADHIEYHPGFTLQQLLASIQQGLVQPWPPTEKA